MIEAVIFDMDGLLIDSEPYWQQAEMNVLGELDVPLTREMCIQTMGIRIDEVVRYWHQRYPWDEQRHSFETVKDRIVDKLIEQVEQSGVAMPGVYQVHQFLKQTSCPLAVASSSDMRIITAVLAKLNLSENYTVTHSAQFESYGKPHPAVFISTADKLGIPPENCLVFEDSLSGTIAAKAAKMACIAVPEPSLRGEAGFAIADLTLNSLEEFTEDVWQKISSTS